MKRKVNRRAERVSVYFWPNVEADKVVLDVVNSLKAAGRTADILRLAMLRGMRELVESGDMPPSLVERLDLKRRLSVRNPTVPFPPVFQMPPAYQPVPASAPTMPASNGHSLDVELPVSSRPESPVGPSFTEAAIQDAESGAGAGREDDMLSGLMGLMSSNRASRDAHEA